jgi:hypothetical protein
MTSSVAAGDGEDDATRGGTGQRSGDVGGRARAGEPGAGRDQAALAGIASGGEAGGGIPVMATGALTD